MKEGVNRTKLIFLQPSFNYKRGGNCFSTSFSVFASRRRRSRLWLVALISFTFASLLALLNTSASRPANVLPNSSVSQSSGEVEKPPLLPAVVFDALVDYAAGSSTSRGKMNEEGLRVVASVLRRRAPCNLLVFGIGHETPLWRALNHGGRTVFVDEREYVVGRAEERNPGLEAYDVAFTTTVRGTPELLAAARQHRRGDCRPVQNLLYSDCGLAVNNLPNQLYGVAWGVILVDGPQGHAPEAPGRASSIFTAAVMARSAPGQVDVLVHDYDREVERVSSGEFLCPENQVGGTPRLAHFVIRAGGPTDEFCQQDVQSDMAATGGGMTAGS